MKRLDVNVTEEQFNKLEDLRKQGFNKSFVVRKSLDTLFLINSSPHIKKLLEELK